MNRDVKSEIYRLIDSIEDEKILQMLMEDVAYYTSDKDIVDELSKEQLDQLDEAISEVKNGETVDWIDFKKEMDEWKKG